MRMSCSIKRCGLILFFWKIIDRILKRFLSCFQNFFAHLMALSVQKSPRNIIISKVTVLAQTNIIHCSDENIMIVSTIIAYR